MFARLSAQHVARQTKAYSCFAIFDAGVPPPPPLATHVVRDGRVGLAAAMVRAILTAVLRYLSLLVAMRRCSACSWGGP